MFTISIDNADHSLPYLQCIRRIKFSSLAYDLQIHRSQILIFRINLFNPSLNGLYKSYYKWNFNPAILSPAK